MATNFPSSIDTFPTHIDNNNEKIAANHLNNIQDVIVEIEQTLGTDPNGSANTVKERLDGIDTTITNHGNLTSSVHGALSTATPNRLIIRDANGRAKIAAPSAIDDIARKDTVDNATATINASLLEIEMVLSMGGMI